MVIANQVKLCVNCDECNFFLRILIFILILLQLFIWGNFDHEFRGGVSPIL